MSIINELTFRKLSDKKPVDLGEYVINYLLDNPGTDIYVGCDSQNHKHGTIYATVVVLHKNNKGGHVLYTKELLPKVLNNFNKLWGEVDRSIRLATDLNHNFGVPIKCVDLDLNPDPKYRSSQVLPAAVGYVESMGFTPRVKPQELWAISAADSICK
jgi:predicted RNase H-related nuclease YkuK (DUF458 family)